MKQKIAFLSMVLLMAMLFSFTASAQQKSFRQTNTAIASKIFSPVAAEYADPADLIGLLCVQLKARGGEAISRLEAINERLGPLAEKAAALDVAIEIENYKEIADHLRKKIDLVCSARDIAIAEENLNQFVKEANSLKIELPKLGLYLQNTLKPALQEKGEAMQITLKESLKAEAKELQDKAEAELKAKAYKEIAARKNQLTQQIKNEVKNRFKSRIEAGEFGNPPDEERVKKEAQAMAGKRAKKEKAKLKKEIQDKYEALAKTEEAAVRTALEEKAQKIKTETMEKFAELRESFKTLKQDIEETAAANYESEWARFETQVKDKKAALIAGIVEAQTNQAKELIEAEQELISLAISQGKQIKSAAALIAELEAGSEKLSAAILNTDLSQEAINKAKNEFQTIWQSVQKEMELIKAKSAKEVIDKTASEIKRTALIYKLNDFAAWGQSTLNFIPRTRNMCANPKTVFPASTRPIERCIICEKFLGGQDQLMFDLIKRLTPKIKNIIPVLKQAEQYKNNPHVTLQQALDMKSRVQEAVNQAQEMKSQYESWQKADQAAAKQIKTDCYNKLDQYTP